MASDESKDPLKQERRADLIFAPEIGGDPSTRSPSSLARDDKKGVWGACPRPAGCQRLDAGPVTV
jgi:hypothetical protein